MFQKAVQSGNREFSRGRELGAAGPQFPEPAPLAATAAAACCTGPVLAPLIVGILGASGAAWAAGLEPYSPWLLGGSLLLLAYGFWSVYWVPKSCGAHGVARGTRASVLVGSHSRAPSTQQKGRSERSSSPHLPVGSAVVWMLFDRNARWTDAGRPEPAWWEHQLQGMPDERRLDPERFAVKSTRAAVARRSPTGGAVTDIRVLVISGSMGSGKTTLLGEASDLLTAGGTPHAAIDLDALGVCHLPSEVQDDLTALNLSAVWSNYAAAGARHLLVSEAIDSEVKLERLRRAIPGAQMVVCRLRAGLSTMKERVRLREPGMLQARYVERVAELEAALDASGIEDFSVDTDDRPVTEAAVEMLTRAGWR